MTERVISRFNGNQTSSQVRCNAFIDQNPDIIFLQAKQGYSGWKPTCLSNAIKFNEKGSISLTEKGISFTAMG